MIRNRFRRTLALCVVGVVTVVFGVGALKASMPWIWWDLFVGSYERSAGASPVLVSVSTLLILVGVGLAFAPVTVRLVDRGGREAGER